MESHEAVILGIVQGLTEFLPVSSSGHLVLVQQLFGLEEAELFFDISVHIGTLVAVTVYFRQELRSIITTIVRCMPFFLKGESTFTDIYTEPDIKLTVLIVAASIPTAAIGFLLSKASDKIFSSVAVVGFMLVVTGLFLFVCGLPLYSQSRSASLFTHNRRCGIFYVYNACTG